jgi:ATP-dependent helicase Lhr and Lhr-like helicase
LAQASLPEALHAATREWFEECFPAGPTRAQSLGWPEILSGHSALLFAPTGSGKTLAAFLAAIDRLMFHAVPEAAARCRVVYISPMRALAVDVERNLRAPLAGIGRMAERRGTRFHAPTLSVRTGDTPARERARLLRHPPDILITTPESLFLVLTSEAHRMLASVEVVIVDEIHALVGSKRGAHLALSLERVAELARRPLQRLGLSATQRPLDEVARFLGGGRRVHVVDAGATKAFDLKVEVPVEDMSRLGQVLEADPLAAQSLESSGSDASSIKRRSIWPAIHPRLLELIRAHRSTIVFVNSRRLAERLSGALNELAGEELVRAHHGSIAREERLLIETALKSGTLRAMVATSSLELGIDMGAVDLVIQIETPPSVASGIQRIGRASHQAGSVSRGVIFPKYRGDLLATAAITRAIKAGDVETTRVPRNPLDILAQQIVAIVAMGERRADDLFALARRAAPFAKLSRQQFEGVLDMLSGRYPSDDFAELRPRVTWDRLRGSVRAREGAKRLAIANAGTIPDRGLFGVFLAANETRGARRVGELDEEMVFESQVGDVFVLGASSWRIAEITRDRVLVVPAPGRAGQTPFWRGDRVFRPVDLGVAIGRLTRELLTGSRARAAARLVAEHDLDPRAAQNLLAYLADQKAATGAVPDDRTLVLERTRDEMGDWRLCLLSPFGGRVHAPLALAIEARLRAGGEPEADAIWNDDGVVVRLPDRERLPDAAALFPGPEEVEDLVVAALGGTALFAGHFREAAARALLLPRRRPGLRTPLWMQRKRAHDLLGVASRYPSFPIVLEAYRECLQDVFDLPGLLDLTRRIGRREVRLVTIDTTTPSPFASALLFGYVANYLYEGDAPLAERRAQALSVDQAQLRELLGEAELRDLLDARILEYSELELQGLSETTKARHADRLHDLLLRVGDLSRAEIAARCNPATAADDWLQQLVRENRALAATIACEPRWIAAQDAARFRDALGVPAPPGLPAAFLEPVAGPLEGLVARYGRGHAPFRTREVARRFGIGEAVVEAVLRRLARENRMLEGEFRPGGRGREWCDPGVLATLRRRSLAALRQQVEPVEPPALGRLLLDWQGVSSAGGPAQGGGDALLDVIEQLQGAAIPASILESDVLPARLPEYRPADLDALCSAGEVVWAGLGTLGERDGRVSLYLASDVLLLHQPGEAPDGALHAAIRAHLAQSGASFFDAIHAAAGAGLERPTLGALWDLVWSGEVTNDSPAALRAFLRVHASRGQERRFRSMTSFRSRRSAPTSGAGRWSLLADRPESATKRLAARAGQLLARHGIVTRDAVTAEAVSGGFTAVYPVLAALEEAGRIRRGYFVRGLGGSQFAQPGALERLRALSDAPRPDAALALAASDPANPYGAALPWPAAGDARPQRVAGAHVFLWGGVLVAFLARGERELLLLLPELEPERSAALKAVALGLAAWAVRSGRTFFGDTRVDGIALGRSALAPYLRAAGFAPAGGGLRRI